MATNTRRAADQLLEGARAVQLTRVAKQKQCYSKKYKSLLIPFGKKVKADRFYKEKLL